MADRFPSISPDGLRIAASALPRGGQAVQFVGDVSGEWQPVPVEFDASGGVWLTSTDLLFTRNKPRDAQDGAILRWDGRIIDLYHDPGLEGWSCHNGRFAGWRRSDRLKSITLSGDGHVAGTVDLGDGRNVALGVDDIEIDRGPIGEPRYTGEALVWVKYVDGIRRVFGRRSHGAATEPLSVFPDDEFWPLAVETPRGLYLLTHGHPEKGRPLFLRPWGQTRGHIVAHGFTDRPDALEVDGGVLVAFSNLVALQRVVVNLAAPLVDPVAPPPPPPPVDPPKETPVQLESKHSQLIEAFAARFPPPGGDEDALRDHWTPKLIEQFVFSFPNEGWCWKSTNPGGRPSSDVIARQVSGGMWGYDVIPGAGTSGWSLNSRPGPIDLRTQAPIRMNPVNHLGATTPPVTPPTQPPVTPSPAGSPFPAFLIPDDVFKVSYRKYVGTPSRPGIYARDRFRENGPDDEFPEGTFIGSTGSLMWYVPIFVRNVVAHIAAHGNNLPTPDEWWALGDKSANDAIAFYRRTAPPE
jgi:hypothetical protein